MQLPSKTAILPFFALGLAFIQYPALRAADLQVGQPAPDFSLQDQDGVVHHLADYRGKSVVLAFYAKDFTGG